MTKVPLEEHLARPLRSFIWKNFTMQEKKVLQTIGLYFINEPRRYFFKFCCNIRRISCLQTGQLPLPYLAATPTVQCTGHTLHGDYLLNHTITSGF